MAWHVGDPARNQCAARRGHSKKSPGRIWRGEFIAGTENARLPRVPKPLLLGRTDFKPVSCGALLFAIACCFRATACGEESRYIGHSIRSFNFGGSHACPTCLRNHHFACTRTWRLLLAPPAGGSNATTEVRENLLSIFARFPGRGPPSTGALLCLMRRPTRSSLKFPHLGVPVRPQLSQPTPAKF